jgi:hypothetical protein
MANEPIHPGLKHEIVLQSNKVLRLVCELIVFAGVGLYIEGVASYGPADALAGVAVAGIGTVFLYRHAGQNQSQSS